MFLAVLVGTIILYLLCLSLFVFLQNAKTKSNNAFAFFTFITAVWILGNFIGANYKEYSFSENFIALDFFAGPILAFSLWYFVEKFLESINLKKHNVYQTLIILLLAIITSVISLFDLIYSFGIDNNGVRSIQYGSLFSLYAIYLGGIVLIVIINLLVALKHAKGQSRIQVRSILFAAGMAAVVIAITNLIVPSITDSASLNLFIGNLSYIGFVIFATVTTYAVVKHRLFNLRLVVARTVGYLLSIGFLVLFFAAISSFFVKNLFERHLDTYWAVAINALILVLAILFYPYLKRYFDKVTNRFFFRDAYDPQEFLDELNKSIVSNIEIGILLRHTTQIIEQNLKSNFVQIVIPKTESTAERIAGTKEIGYSDHELNFMRGRLVGLGKKIITPDELSPDEDELQKIMNSRDISILVHLSATSYGQQQTIAYMIFGTKKSGNVYSKDDLKIIEIIADELVIAIQNALRFEEIQEFNVTLQSKVNSATSKLRRTNDKLKAMDETKDEFISMASHQLRTPLTSVKGYLSMVLEGDAGQLNDEQRKLLDQAFVSSQRMVYLIADLLNVSRLRTGKFIIEANQANLANIVEGEVAQLKEQASSKGLTLTYEKPDDFPELVIDETKIRQVVMNFVDNALYYTPAGGKINVSLTTDKNHAYLMVKDNGLGVPKDEQKHLFTKFYRAKNARNVRPDGTGLGLFMAKKVVTAQGGNILFESKENKGSTFGFSLPLKKLAVKSETE